MAGLAPPSPMGVVLAEIAKHPERRTLHVTQRFFARLRAEVCGLVLREPPPTQLDGSPEPWVPPEEQPGMPTISILGPRGPVEIVPVEEATPLEPLP